MSTENKQDVLFGKVYLPVFMQKLASRGVKLETEADLEGSLKIAAMTRSHVAAQPAAEPVSVIKEAAARLESQLHSQTQSTAASFLQDPEIVAALS